MKRTLRQIALLLAGLQVFACAGHAVSSPEEKTNEPLTFIDNGMIRVGVKKAAGAAIAWFSDSKTKRNLVNHYDRGRLIQQSYYGNVDGSKWADKPWRWNPVQGGDYRGKSAKVIKFKADRHKLYAKTQPVHWATGQPITDVTMEQWITLDKRVAHVRFRMVYRGKVTHRPRHQEIPAVFVDRSLATLLLYDGDQPWRQQPVRRLQPGETNEYHRITENWAAYVDDQGIGLGVYVPTAERITCYRVAKPGERGACSYFAPIATFGIKSGLAFSYDVYLTIGSGNEIRKTFQTIAKEKASE